MAAVFKWRIEKYSRCYPSEQPAQPSQALATSVQPIWVHLSNRNLELCLTGIAIPRHDPISQVSTPLLRIYTDGQMVLVGYFFFFFKFCIARDYKYTCGAKFATETYPALACCPKYRNLSTLIPRMFNAYASRPWSRDQPWGSDILLATNTR